MDKLCKTVLLAYVGEKIATNLMDKIELAVRKAGFGTAAPICGGQSSPHENPPPAGNVINLRTIATVKKRINFPYGHIAKMKASDLKIRRIFTQSERKNSTVKRIRFPLQQKWL